ncbi:MAG TPA: lysophospholipid acyltransferase family protein [Myxococcota bacterium]|nr:lysophospholipid acyltransferase family protein [Myxococcota bacterium]
MLAYQAVRAVVRTALHVFFRDVHVAGREHIPLEGTRPVIFAGNHPNSLIDPALVVATSGRIVHFAAKDKLFAPPFGLVLAAVGAVPIQRAMEHGDGPRDNAGSLRALQDLLARGRSTGIFPEGLSHDESHLQRLRTGAARVALQTAADHPGVSVAIVPVGLTYKHRKRFRSRVLVQYGAPIDVAPADVDAYRADPFEASRDLTTRIETALRSLTINAPDWETLRVLDAVRRMYQPANISLADRVELARRFCDGYDRVKDEPDVTSLFQDVAAWLDDLDDTGLDDADLMRALRPSELAARALANLLRLVFWLPLALPSLVVHGPLIVMVSWAGVRFSPRNDVVGTTKLMLGIVLVPLLYALVPLLIGLAVSPTAGALAALALPIGGFATLRTLERGTSLRRILRAAGAARTLADQRDDLLARRRALETRVVDAVRAHLPPGMIPMFPRP